MNYTRAAICQHLAGGWQGFQTTDRVRWTCHVNFVTHIRQNCNYLQIQSMEILFLQWGWGITSLVSSTQCKFDSLVSQRLNSFYKTKKKKKYSFLFVFKWPGVVPLIRFTAVLTDGINTAVLCFRQQCSPSAKTHTDSHACANISPSMSCVLTTWWRVLQN